jgi:hypothetical protein
LSALNSVSLTNAKKLKMKYFTIDRWIADQGSEDPPGRNEISREDYLIYLDGIRSQLPTEFLLLTGEVVIHDARLVALKASSDEGTLELTFEPGPYTERDWKQIRLRYIGVGRLHLTSDPDKGLAGPNGFGDLGYDEIEVLGGGMFEHRLLFSSGIELMVEFAAFTLGKQ